MKYVFYVERKSCEKIFCSVHPLLPLLKNKALPSTFFSKKLEGKNIFVTCNWLEPGNCAVHYQKNNFKIFI
jgi:hypothetical protein